MTNTILTPLQAVRIQKSNKTFILFDTRKDRLTNYTLTDDLRRHRNKYNNFRLLDVFKKELTIKL